MILDSAQVTSENLFRELQQLAMRLDLADIEEAYYFPKYYQLETTRICNARCPFCAIDKWNKDTPFMSDDLFNKIADEMGRYSHWINTVAIQRAGEPLLDKKLVERIKKLKGKGMRCVNLSTNASLLTESKARALLLAGLDEIMFSIDSVVKETYEKMRVGLKFETVLANIETFFKVRDEMKPDMIVRVRAISFSDCEKYSEEMDSWKAFWEQFKRPQDRIYLKRAHSWGNQVEWDDRIVENETIYHPCIMPWSTMHILSDGRVALCGNDYDARLCLGNIAEDTIYDVWHNEQCGRVRRLHASGRRNEIPFCRGCRLWDIET